MLNPLIKDDIFIVKLKSPENHYRGIALKNEIECFSEEDSEYVYLQSAPSIKARVERLALFGSRIPNLEIFWMKRPWLVGPTILSRIIVSENFKNIVEKSELSGVFFDEVILV